MKVRAIGRSGEGALRGGAMRPGVVHVLGSICMRNTCEFVVGRLLEIRVAAGYKSVADVDEMIEMIAACVSALPADGTYSIAADWRAVNVMGPDTAERARIMLARTNPRVVRSSILTLSENPMSNLQTIRIIREAENPNRRHFTSARMLHAWLSEVLTAEESVRLASFFDLSGQKAG